MFERGHYYYDVASHVSADHAKARADEVRHAAEFMQSDIERLLMITEALWSMVKEHHGYTDDELFELDRWIRAHTLDRFGPVRTVEAGLVLEVAFDSVHRSKRHKSGVAMRFPRIHRIRWDKPAAEADRLETLLNLIAD